MPRNLKCLKQSCNCEKLTTYNFSFLFFFFPPNNLSFLFLNNILQKNLQCGIVVVSRFIKFNLLIEFLNFLNFQFRYSISKSIAILRTVAEPLVCNYKLLKILAWLSSNQTHEGAEHFVKDAEVEIFGHALMVLSILFQANYDYSASNINQT